jgi:Protein of unknown function (DUF4231)
MSSFERSLATIELTETQKSILHERYTRLLQSIHRRTVLFSFYFHTSRFIVTVGSLLVPALLSIQTGGDILYWIVWACSLLVTTSNGVITLFKIDKKYFLLHTIYEQLKSEGWQFLELTGKYSGYNTPSTPPTHQNQFIFFCAAVEKIRIKQIKEEYYKIEDKDKGKSEPVRRDEYMPPTPFKPGATNPELTQMLLGFLSQHETGDAFAASKTNAAAAERPTATAPAAERRQSPPEAGSENGSTQSLSVFEDV